MGTAQSSQEYIPDAGYVSTTRPTSGVTLWPARGYRGGEGVTLSPGEYPKFTTFSNVFSMRLAPNTYIELYAKPGFLGRRSAIASVKGEDVSDMKFILNNYVVGSLRVLNK